MARHQREYKRTTVEFSTTDQELIDRLRHCSWPGPYHWSVPDWWSNGPDAGLIGTPADVPEFVLDGIREEDDVPRTNDEQRFQRNHELIKHIYAEVRSQLPERIVPLPPTSGKAALRPSHPIPLIDLTGLEEADGTSLASETVNDCNVQLQHHRKPPPTSLPDLAVIQPSPVSAKSFNEEAKEKSAKAATVLAQYPSKPPKGNFPQANIRCQHVDVALCSLKHSRSSSDNVLKALKPRVSSFFASAKGTSHPGAISKNYLPELKEKDRTISQLRGELAQKEIILQDLRNNLWQHEGVISSLEWRTSALMNSLRGEISLKQEALRALHAIESVQNAQLASANQSSLQKESEVQVDAGNKRKAPPLSPMRLGESNMDDKDCVAGHLLHLANEIATDLDAPAFNETIHLCGLAPLRIIASDPDEVLKLAEDKLYTFPFHRVPTQWRRLYEEASLHKATLLLRQEAETLEEPPKPAPAKRRKLLGGNSACSPAAKSDWLQDVVGILDKGIAMSGAPGRKPTFDAIFQVLENFIDSGSDTPISKHFTTARPAVVMTSCRIARVDKALALEDFQTWLSNTSEPLIIPDVLGEWPASQLWQDPNYLLSRTLGGRRVVHVEIGESYTAEGWGQRSMTMREFMTTYVLNANPPEMGYLAQYELFTQIPALQNDICIPDYCYSTPPPVESAALQTAGLHNVKSLDEPLMNAWFGPAGTKTPLHTDPYHNILCQIVGYKYVRLYAPNETSKLYPMGVDDKGINMDNTSEVDVSLFRQLQTDSTGRGLASQSGQGKAIEKYPMFTSAKYVERILGPGECLYVPLGWWHYVESLTTSFSVSFWWN